jgi:hypothetical protein
MEMQLITVTAMVEVLFSWCIWWQSHQFLFFMVFRGAANRDPPEVCRSWKIPGSGTVLVG